MSDRPTYIGLKASDMGFDAHLTVMYLGKMNSEKETKVRDVIHRIGRQEFLVARKGIRFFGEMFNIPVVLVEDVDESARYSLATLRKRLEHPYGLKSKSEYPFNPHITLKFDHYNTVNIPLTIKLDRLGLY